MSIYILDTDEQYVSLSKVLVVGTTKSLPNSPLILQHKSVKKKITITILEPCFHS